jgi:hypothetical protein
MPVPLDLTAYSAPPQRVRFPNGSEHLVHPFDAEAWRLSYRCEQTRAHADALAVLHHICPTATERDIASLGAAHAAALLELAQGMRPQPGAPVVPDVPAVAPVADVFGARPRAGLES